MRNDRGIALPSPVVLLSAAAVVLAAIAFVVTRGHGSDQVELATKTAPVPGVTSTAPKPSGTPSAKPTKRATSAVKRSKVKVVVFNNTNVKGLAATVGTRVSQAGWHFLAADNWQGTVPATTVYYGKGLAAAGKQLGLDLGIKRVVARDASATGMLADGLTVILVGPLH